MGLCRVVFIQFKELVSCIQFLSTELHCGNGCTPLFCSAPVWTVKVGGLLDLKQQCFAISPFARRLEAVLPDLHQVINHATKGCTHTGEEGEGGHDP